MYFDYRPSIAVSPTTGEGIILLRPDIEVVVHGPLGSRIVTALVDTGSDLSVLPLAAAHVTGIIVAPSNQPQARDFGGSGLSFFEGKVELEIFDPRTGDALRWFTEAQFFDFGAASETAVLGHDGFLNHFTATFDGEDAALELIANRTLPIAEDKQT